MRRIVLCGLFFLCCACRSFDDVDVVVIGGTAAKAAGSVFKPFPEGKYAVTRVTNACCHTAIGEGRYLDEFLEKAGADAPPTR